MSDTDHRHTPAEERAIREAALDETIAETFPASDPPSSIPNPDEHFTLLIGRSAPNWSSSDNATRSSQWFRLRTLTVPGVLVDMSLAGQTDQANKESTPASSRS